MTVFKTTLLAATALTMLTGAALAGDNEAYIHQGSTGNEASIIQQGTGNNQAGKSDQPGGAIDQGADAGTGSYNKLTIDQNGQNLKVGTLGNYVTDGANLGGAGVDQYGNASVATVKQTGTANQVGSILQTGAASGATTGNRLTITQSNSGNNVDYVGQKYVAGSASRDANNATLTFTGLNNGTNGRIGYAANQVNATVSVDGKSSPNGVWQVGAGNSTDLTVSGNRNSFGIRQVGEANKADGLNVAGFANSLAISQEGIGNDATVGTIAGNSIFNSIGILQLQDGNKAVVNVKGGFNGVLTKQDGKLNVSTADITGNFNGIYAEQIGGGNESSVVVSGDANYLNSYQNGTGNIITASITGSRNNQGDFRSGLIKANRSLAGLSLGAGQIVQEGGSVKSNEVDLTVSSSDNLLATYQKGNGNNIDGTITGGRFNQAFVAQIGNGNLTNFVQNGTANVVSIVQK